MFVLGLLPTREACLVIFLEGIVKILTPDQLYAKYLELAHILVGKIGSIALKDYKNRKIPSKELC